MAKDTERYHVVTISPTQQIVLRLALNEHFKRQADFVIVAAARDGLLKSDQALDRFDQYFQYYQISSAGLPSTTGGRGAQTRILYLTKPAMKYINDAVNQFDIKAYSGSFSQSALDTVYPKLKALVNEAVQFDYGTDEIRKAGG